MDTLMRGIYYLVFVGGAAFYAYLNYTFLDAVVDAPDGRAPNLPNGDVQLAAAIGGAFGGVFAAAFGIQRQTPTVNEKKLRVGQTLTPRAEVVTSVCVVVYFVVGLAILYISRAHGAETPQELKAAATVFAGYLASIFLGVVSGPGKTA